MTAKASAAAGRGALPSRLTSAAWSPDARAASASVSDCARRMRLCSNESGAGSGGESGGMSDDGTFQMKAREI